MNWDRIGRGARAIRLRLGLRQVDLAARAGVDRGAVSRLERGHGRRLSGARLESILDALGARLDGRLAWRGADLDRMLDARHAQLQSGTKRRLEAWSWEVRAEVSFNRYGERGRVDLFAWHPASRSVAVIEVKTELVDAQALLGAMDVRTRLAPGIARGLGSPYPAAVVPVILRRGPDDASSAGRAGAALQPLRGARPRGNGLDASAVTAASARASVVQRLVKRFVGARQRAARPVPPSALTQAEHASAAVDR